MKAKAAVRAPEIDQDDLVFAKRLRLSDECRRMLQDCSAIAQEFEVALDARKELAIVLLFAWLRVREGHDPRQSIDWLERLHSAARTLQEFAHCPECGDVNRGGMRLPFPADQRTRLGADTADLAELIESLWRTMPKLKLERKRGRPEDSSSLKAALDIGEMLVRRGLPLKDSPGGLWLRLLGRVLAPGLKDSAANVRNMARKARRIIERKATVIMHDL